MSNDMFIGTTDNDAAYQVATVKKLRHDGDAVIQQVKALSPSRERSLVVTKLQEAVMWLGMDLKRLAEQNPELQLPNPYPTSKDCTAPGVEPTSQGLKL